MEEEDEGCREEYKKGLWTAEEDKMLMEYVKYYGKGHWNSISKRTGLKRCGKSCRLRWMNYLSPNVKKGRFTEDEEDLIIRLHRLLGNRWSLIAGRVPGRTDNQVKNYWNTHLSKKLGIFNKKKQTRTTVVDSSTSVHCNGKKTTNIGMNPESSSSSVEINRKKKITGTATTHFNPHTAENVSGKDGADICEKDDMRRKMDSDEVAADDEKTMEIEMQQPISGMVIVGSSEEDSMMSSTVASFWVSEFDKMMSSSSSGEGNSGSFMELIDDEHLFGFGLLDWNQF